MMPRTTAPDIPRPSSTHPEVAASEPFHFAAAGQQTGLHPERADYGTFLSLADPDRNGWLVQDVRERAPGR